MYYFIWYNSANTKFIWRKSIKIQQAVNIFSNETTKHDKISQVSNMYQEMKIIVNILFLFIASIYNIQTKTIFEKYVIIWDKL